MAQDTRFSPCEVVGSNPICGTNNYGYKYIKLTGEIKFMTSINYVNEKIHDVIYNMALSSSDLRTKINDNYMSFLGIPNTPKLPEDISNLLIEFKTESMKYADKSLVHGQLNDSLSKMSDDEVVNLVNLIFNIEHVIGQNLI